MLRPLLWHAQNERVLFHYNGHGVPRPTANGEIWVFNSRYTQYIPLSIYELQVRSPTHRDSARCPLPSALLLFHLRLPACLPAALPQSWLGTPCIYVLDCSAAGLIISAIRQLLEQQRSSGLVRPGRTRRLHMSRRARCRRWA